MNDPELHGWLVNAGEDYATAYGFIDELQVSGIPILLDEQETYYKPYAMEVPGYAPFPLQVVIDRDGEIVYLSKQYDVDAAVAAIEAALAKE
ncbi:MAG: peroxiredoxin [Cognaticolwellia sp.]